MALDSGILKKIRSLGKEILTSTDTQDAAQQVVSAFEALATIYMQMRDESVQETADLKKKFADAVRELKQTINDHFNKMQRGPIGPKGDKGDAGLGVPGVKGAAGKDGRDGKDGSPDTPEQVRDKLESLKGNNRLSISAIAGLDEELKKRIATGGQPVYVPVGGGGSGHNMAYYDLSSQLNGVLTSFSLPAFFKILDVKLSSKPVLRQTTDYTIDGSLMTISFTSEIDASTDLSSGQSLIVLYAE